MKWELVISKCQKEWTLAVKATRFPRSNSVEHWIIGSTKMYIMVSCKLHGSNLPTDPSPQFGWFVVFCVFCLIRKGAFEEQTIGGVLCKWLIVSSLLLLSLAALSADSCNSLQCLLLGYSPTTTSHINSYCKHNVVCNSHFFHVPCTLSDCFLNKNKKFSLVVNGEVFGQRWAGGCCILRTSFPRPPWHQPIPPSHPVERRKAFGGL